MKGWRWMSLMACCALVWVSLSTSSAWGQTKLAYSVFFPGPHKMAALAVEWGKEIEKRTDGKVKISVFPGGTLSPADQCYDGVVRGISDIGMSLFAYTRGKFPLTEVVDFPSLGSRSGWASTKLINQYYRKFKPRELEDVQVMYLHALGPAIIHTKRPVEKLEDLKGMKILCHGLGAKAVGALGALPVAMPIPERYDALQKGIADGAVHPMEANKGFKMAEVTKYTTLCFGASYSAGLFVVMNKGKWNSLAPDIRKIIEQINEEWIEKTGKAWDEIDKEGTEVTLARGNQIISLSNEEDERWARLVRPIAEEYVKSTKEKGLPGEEALKFCLEELARIQ